MQLTMTQDSAILRARQSSGVIECCVFPGRRHPRGLANHLGGDPNFYWVGFFFWKFKRVPTRMHGTGTFLRNVTRHMVQVATDKFYMMTQLGTWYGTGTRYYR